MADSHHISTPDLSDAFPEHARACELQFLHFGRRRAFSGRIQTVKCFEDNSLVKSTLAEAGDGRVLVVDGGASLRRALLGDLIAASAVKNDWAGLIFNGAIRDVDEVNELDIGVRALGTCPVKTEKLGQGQLGATVSFGGVEFAPGDYVYVDVNGVLVSKEKLAL